MRLWIRAPDYLGGGHATKANFEGRTSVNESFGNFRAGQWRANLDACAPPGFGLDEQRTVDQPDAFLHAREAEAAFPPPPFDVETSSRIRHHQTDTICLRAQFDPRFWGSAMANHVVEGLLDDAIQAQGQIRRELARERAGVEVDRTPVCFDRSRQKPRAAETRPS